MSQSEWNKPIYRHLNELFIQPFVEQLIEKYPKKTLQHHDIVQLCLQCISARQLDLQTIRFIDPLITPTRTNEVINALESLWRVYHNKVDLSAVFPEESKRPSLGYQLQRFCRQTLDEIVAEYYGKFTPEDRYKAAHAPNTTMLRKTLETVKRETADLLSSHAPVHSLSALEIAPTVYSSVLEMKLTQLNEALITTDQIHLNTPTGPNRHGTYLHHVDLSGRDFCERRISWSAAGSNFSRCKFHGEGHTGHCIHWYVPNCDFTDAQFSGSICNKTSVYDGSNFTRVNLTPLMFNCSECSFKNCNLTNAYVLSPLPWTPEGKKLRPDGFKKLMGRELVRYLTEERRLPAEGCYYHSPKDSGYDPEALDDRIWQENTTDNTNASTINVTKSADNDEQMTDPESESESESESIDATRLELVHQITQVKDQKILQEIKNLLNKNDKQL